MEESEENISVDDVKMSDTSSSAKTKLKKRPLVERELETSLSARVTSPLTHGDASSTSRYGRARRLKTENDFVNLDNVVSKSWNSPELEKTPVKIQSPAYKMHASNSPVKIEPVNVTPNKSHETNLENQIESIYHENMSLSRFGSIEKNKSPTSLKNSKVYVRKDLIQKRDQEEAVTLIKNLFSPQNAWKSGDNHLSNFLERSSEKYSLNSSSPKNTTGNECTNTASVVKALDFDSTKKKTKDSKNCLTKNQLFELEAKCEYQVGDLAWARMGTFPFWPCIITREPSSGMFVKTKTFGRVEHEVMHVTFFGDNGRHSWIVDNMLRKFLGQLEFEATREHFSLADKKKDPKLCAAFLVSEKKMPQWSVSVEEAETLLREPKRLRIDVFNEMLVKSRSAKASKPSKPQKIAKLIRTGSDVSLSESLYDTLFSGNIGPKDDTDRSRNKSRKSLDVSEVVTACLDNMAAKTGITKIKRQSHMDRWLQKAKSKTPEKSKVKVISSKKPSYYHSSKKKKKQTLKKVPIKNPHILRKSNESRKVKSQNTKNNNNKGLKSQVLDEAIISGSGIGYISKVESLSEKLADELSKAVAEMEYLENDNIETYETPVMEVIENDVPICESPTFTQDFGEVIHNESETEANIPNIVMEVHIDVEHYSDMPPENEINESELNTKGKIQSIENGHLDFSTSSLKTALSTRKSKKDSDVNLAVNKIINEPFINMNGHPVNDENIISNVSSQNNLSVADIDTLKEINIRSDMSIEIDVSLDTVSDNKVSEMSVHEALNNGVEVCNGSLDTSGNLSDDFNTDNNNTTKCVLNSTRDLDTSVNDNDLENHENIKNKVVSSEKSFSNSSKSSAKSTRKRRTRLSVPIKKGNKKRSLRLKTQTKSEISNENSFTKYVELHKDAIMDENPELTQSEIMEYLRKTWDYELNDNKDLANHSEDCITKQVNSEKISSNFIKCFENGILNFEPIKCTVKLSDVLRDNKYFNTNKETKLNFDNTDDSTKGITKDAEGNPALTITAKECLLDSNVHESINDTNEIDDTLGTNRQVQTGTKSWVKELQKNDIECEQLNDNDAFENCKEKSLSGNTEDKSTNYINQNKANESNSDKLNNSIENESNKNDLNQNCEKEETVPEPNPDKLNNTIENNENAFVNSKLQEFVLDSLDNSCDKLEIEKSNIMTKHVISNSTINETGKTGLDNNKSKSYDALALETLQDVMLKGADITYISSTKKVQEEKVCDHVNSDNDLENKDNDENLKPISSVCNKNIVEQFITRQEINTAEVLDTGANDLYKKQDELDCAVEPMNNEAETTIPSINNTDIFKENNDFDESLYSNDKLVEDLKDGDHTDMAIDDITGNLTDDNVTEENDLTIQVSHNVQQVNIQNDIGIEKCDEKKLNTTMEIDNIENEIDNEEPNIKEKSFIIETDSEISTNKLSEPIMVNGFHSISECSPDFSDTELNLEISSINSEDSEPLSKVKNKLALKSLNKVKNSLEDPEFIKYMELRQDALMDEHPELNQEQIVEYMYKTWQYEENSKSDLIKNDEMENYGIVKGLNDNLRQKSIRNSFRESRKRKKKQSDEDSLSISSDISDISMKKSLRRVRLTRSPDIVLDDCRKSLSKERTLENKVEDKDEVTSINSDISDRSLRNNLHKRGEVNIDLSESTFSSATLKLSVSRDNIQEDVTTDETIRLSPLNNESSKIDKYYDIFKQTLNKGQKNNIQEINDCDNKVKVELDPETASINSEESETSVSKSKQRNKQSNQGIDSPEFLQYLELRQDQIIDENPQLTQKEIKEYLYKTWLYEESVKSDIKKSDDIEQANLVKGLNTDSPQLKKMRKKIKTEKELTFEHDPIDKEKPKRKTSQPYYNEDLSDMEDETELFEIFKPKTKLQTDKVEDDAGKPSRSEVIDLDGDDGIDEVELYFLELTKPKPNLFKGLVREKVCDICEKTGNLVKCKGCNNMFHVDCVNKVVEIVEAPTTPVRGRKKKKKPGRKPKNLDESESQSDEKSQDISEENNVSIEEVVEPVSWVVDAENFEAVLSAKMRELIPNGEANYDAYSGEEGLNWNGTIAGKCEIFDVKIKPKIEATDYSDFKCKSCQSNEVPVCFVCKQAVSKSGVDYKQRCQTSHCCKYYHMECLNHWPQTQFNAGELSKFSNKHNERFDEFMCPRHVCHTCVSDDPRGCKTRFSGDKLARCVRCPATYHTFTKCLPAGTQILTGSHIVCPRHYDHRPGKVPCHVNTGWCFLCALGGSLICCEYCPTSFHAECLNIKPPEGGYMCEDCETGRLPLYGEMVWVKLGHYRWWPGLILHPKEIPENIMAVKHSPGEFVVRFFGQYDHYWVNRGRVFPFQEGDSGRISSQKSKIDADFTTAMEHAHRACAILKRAEPNEEEDTDIASSLLPPHYVKLKVNRPVGSLCGKRIDIEESSLTQCECNPDEEDPCGLYSQCLNRMLLTECGPLCRAGDRCNNRAFEKRQYPRMAPYKTPYRGWGLKALQDIKSGQFVIEYVGELIDEEEFKRRMNRKHEIRDENYYFLTLDKERMIDAGPKGNLARFMNHCCEPNCETQKWTVLGDVRVGLFAMKDIPANSELTFNYNLECAGIEKKRCLCGAKRCSGYMGAKRKQEETQPKKTKLPQGQKRTYNKKKKNVEDSPSTAKSKSKKPVGRPAKPRELTEIEKDLLIIKNATNGLSSDSEASGRLSVEQDRNSKALKRKRVSFSTDEVSSPISKKTKLDEENIEVGD